MTDQKMIVEICNLGKRYPGTEALKEVNLEITSGQIWGLLGPNGSGKSTLLKCIAGLLRPDRGTVKVMGMHPSRATKAKVAYLPEVDHFYKWMKVGQMLEFFADMYPDWQETRVSDLLKFMNLNREQRISSLSKGMRARLKLVTTMARTAKLVLLDEPLSGIDPASRGRIVDVILSEFDPKEQAMILSTHEVGETESLFDAVILLEQGCVKLVENADDVRQKRNMSITDLFKEVFL